MNTQEILPEPIPQPGETISNSPESIEGTEHTNEEQASKVVESQPGAQAGGAALSGAHLSTAQSQVGGAAQDPVSGMQSDGQTSSTVTAHLSADDLDLIEKEWVKKAKEIVDATQNDPHVQSDELSKVKADYIKKRYGKDVKVKED